MSKKKIAVSLILVAACMFFVTGCYKVATLYPDTDGALVDKEVSLVNDIIPVFNQNCAIGGCHGPGGTSPDLSAAKAYISLTNGGYLDLDDPKSSKLYLRLTGEIPPAMPLGSTNNPSNINALVLTWITQQAKNN